MDRWTDRVNPIFPISPQKEKEEQIFVSEEYN